MAAHSNGQAIIFGSCGYYLYSFFFFLAYSQGSEIGCLPYFHTYDVGFVRIYNAGLKCAARGSMKIQDAKITHKKSPSAHHRATLSGYIFTTKAYIINCKKSC